MPISKDCVLCNGTGEERSGVCHCGAEMEGHSLYDNHSATEMTRPCPNCRPGESNTVEVEEWDFEDEDPSEIED